MPITLYRSHPVYLTLILGLLTVVERAAETLPKLMAAAKRDKEMTPEEEAELDLRMTRAFGSAAWKTDDELAAERMAGEGGGAGA